VEHGGVDRAAVRRRGERTRRVAGQRDDRDRRAAERRTQALRVEHPDVGAIHAGLQELGIAGPVLAPVRRRDEHAAPRRSGDDDVTGLVADEQGAHDTRLARLRRIDHDDAHAVGEMVHDERLHAAVGADARRDGDRLEPDRHVGREREARRGHAVHGETIVRGVDREHEVARGRVDEGDRTHVPALEVDVGPGVAGEAGDEHCDRVGVPPMRRSSRARHGAARLAQRVPGRQSAARAAMRRRQCPSCGDPRKFPAVRGR
jgi:hypothetical protein